MVGKENMDSTCTSYKEQTECLSVNKLKSCLINIIGVTNII